MIHVRNYLINLINAFGVSNQASGTGGHTHSYEVIEGKFTKWKRDFQFLPPEYLSPI